MAESESNTFRSVRRGPVVSHRLSPTRAGDERASVTVTRIRHPFVPYGDVMAAVPQLRLPQRSYSRRAAVTAAAAQIYLP